MLPLDRFYRLRPLIAVLLCCVASSLHATDIRVGGTGNALGLMRLLGEAYMQSHPGDRVVVLPSIGSSGAIKAVPGGRIELGVSSRPLSEAERADGTADHEFAQTPTVFAVSSKSTARNVTRAQLAGIYAGSVTQWPDGTPIRPLIRQPGDDNTKQMITLSADIERAQQEAEKRPGLPYATTDTEAADKLESIPGALGVTTIGLIRSEKRSLRALSLDKVEPNEKNIRAGTYPLVKRFYLIFSGKPSAETERFMAFVKSPAGRNILHQSGHWPP